jgi:tetratricopeptide (TPR) repeat protein
VEESLAQVLLFVKRFADAEPLLRSQLERDSTNVQIRSDLAAAIAGQGRMDEAATLYAALLAQQDLTSTQLFNLGLALFRARDFGRAAEAFARLTEVRPDSRDAWFNYANALFAGDDWQGLVKAGDRLIQLDPLGQNVGLIAARAHLETRDIEGARSGMARVDGAPLYVEGLTMLPFGTATRIVGRLIGNTAEPGTPVRLRFSFYDEADPLGSETLDVPAPAKGETTQLEVLFQTGATAFRYELVN